MPVTLHEDLATLSGVVTVEDAEPLAEWLRTTPSGRVSLEGCTALHTAALQLLLAARVPVSGTPADPFLAQHILPLVSPPARRPRPARPAIISGGDPAP
jgi:hypothetical protein